jgi:hypothetical protein
LYNNAYNGGAINIGEITNYLGVYSCKFVGNAAAQNGGVINIGTASANITFLNNFMILNTAYEGGTFHLNEYTGKILIENCY